VPVPIKRDQPLSLDEWTGSGLSGSGTLIGIYMTPLSVHVNRAPVEGTIRAVLPRPAAGPNRSMASTFLRTLWDMLPAVEAAEYVLANARNTLVIDGPFPVAMVQIADRHVAEVDCWVSPGQKVARGERVGMIRMGSQVDLFLPDRPGLRVTCALGERLLAGASIVATYEPPATSPPSP
jgi:phosphatidylserine decarboxylase